jgi:hypothetical protein
MVCFKIILYLQHICFIITEHKSKTMRKYLLVFFGLIIASMTFAQESHMKFMGIPLNGQINSFQTKLLNKGIIPDKEINATMPVGVRAFKGDFAGFESIIYVYYDKNSKIVYRAKACIDNTDENIFERQYKQLKDLVETKYSDGFERVGEQDGHESIVIYTRDGIVGIYTSKFFDHYPETYTIHVDYEDDINSSKHEDSQLDDI